MRLLNIRGKLVSKNVSYYLIKWDKPSRSNFQFDVKQFLKKYWQNHIVYEEFPVYGTKLRVDILNATMRIAVEVNGVQHVEFSKFFHGYKSNFFRSIQRDINKIQWLELNNFKIVEIEPTDMPLTVNYIKNKLGVSII